MKRTYEWILEDGETVWSQQIIRTDKKTPCFEVSKVSIGSCYFGRPGQCYLEVEGFLNEKHNAPYHDGTAWVWSERPL
jgi:hypothetical protein